MKEFLCNNFIILTLFEKYMIATRINLRHLDGLV